MNDFSRRIKYFRSLNDLSQDQLAKIVGVSRKQISDYEVGTNTPRSKTFIKILKAFNVSEAEFNSDSLEYIPEIAKSNAASDLALILASPNRGKIIQISGIEKVVPDAQEVVINIFVGTITRTKQEKNDFTSVYYLTSQGEDCILVQTKEFSKIRDELTNF